MTADGTPQHIPKECVPYDKGFAEFRIGPETLEDVAYEYSVTAQQLLDADPVLKALRGTPDKVVPGDVVVILTSPPTDRTISAEQITFEMIASAFQTSKQAIFDHARNAALKARRKSPAGVIAGDRVVVSWELLPNGSWVIGHDL